MALGLATSGLTKAALKKWSSRPYASTTLRRVYSLSRRNSEVRPVRLHKTAMHQRALPPMGTI